MKRNDYVQYLNPYTHKFIICQIEEIYGDGHVLLYAVDTNLGTFVLLRNTHDSAFRI